MTAPFSHAEVALNGVVSFLFSVALGSVVNSSYLFYYNDSDFELAQDIEVVIMYVQQDDEVRYSDFYIPQPCWSGDYVWKPRH